MMIVHWSTLPGVQLQGKYKWASSERRDLTTAIYAGSHLKPKGYAESTKVSNDFLRLLLELPRAFNGGK